MKRLLLVTNLFPRPDMPRCGVFNAHFARALQVKLKPETRNQKSNPSEFGLSCNDCNVQRVTPLHILVPVPEWRVWRLRRIRRWQVPEEALVNQKSESGNWKWGRGEHKILGQKSAPSAFSFQFSAFPSVHYVPVFYIPVIGRALSGWFHMRALSRYRSLFEECDAVLGSWLYPDCVAAAAVAAEAGKQFWARLHGTDRFHLDARGRGAACRRVLDAAEGVFVNAEFMRQELVERGIEKGKIHVVRNGVDRDLFRPRTTDHRPQTADLRPPTSDGVRTVLWVGNLVSIKGPDVALKAFAEMVHSHYTPLSTVHTLQSTVHLVVIGAGPMRGTLQELARGLGIEDEVTFLGSVPHEDVALWMNRADCLLLSSHSEGMPNVVVEALASGTPVVATDVGDVSAVVRDGENGRVVQTADQRPQTADQRPQTADQRPQTADQRPQTADGNQDSALIADLADALKDVLSREWDVEQLRESVAEFDWQRTAEAVLSKFEIGKSES
jgi:teichuronic acid biosynthesis glycosyltransferase TuaC